MYMEIFDQKIKIFNILFLFILENKILKKEQTLIQRIDIKCTSQKENLKVRFKPFGLYTDKKKERYMKLWKTT